MGNLSILRAAIPTAQVSSYTTGSITLPSARGAFVEPGDFESIASYTATGTVSDVTFSSIPSTYKILQVRGIGRGSNAGSGDLSVFAQFNGDTTSSNYRSNRIYSYGSTNGHGLDFGSNFLNVGISLENGSTGGDFGGMIFEIIDYANTSKQKSVRSLSGSSASQFASAGQWLSTSAIDSIRIYLSTGSWVANTTFALYGIK